MRLRGCGTALVTPFKSDGSLDEAALRELVDWQVESGIDFLVPCGTTGETPTLSHDEWLRVVDLTIETAAARVPIMAGATSNNTREAVAKAKEISCASRRRLRPHGDAVLQQADPGRRVPAFQGHCRSLGEAAGAVQHRGANRDQHRDQHSATAGGDSQHRWGERGERKYLADCRGLCHVPEDFLVFSGDDAVTLAVIGLGGVGIISVVSNEIPAEMARLTQAALANKWDTARLLFRKYLPLMQANFIESNPGPAKALLSMMGRMEEIYRLPLVPMKKENRAEAGEGGGGSRTAATGILR